MSNRPHHSLNPPHPRHLLAAAAMWNRPHLVALDEPTNYIDKETLKALVRSTLLSANKWY
jgi:ABC-type molybdenum transport system ATPase subunit/photorepair protein PhrA